MWCYNIETEEGRGLHRAEIWNGGGNAIVTHSLWYACIKTSSTHDWNWKSSLSLSLSRCLSLSMFISISIYPDLLTHRPELVISHGMYPAVMLTSFDRKIPQFHTSAQSLARCLDNQPNQKHSNFGALSSLLFKSISCTNPLLFPSTLKRIWI